MFIDDEVRSRGTAAVDLGSRVKAPDESFGISTRPGERIGTLAIEVAYSKVPPAAEGGERSLGSGEG
jgi:hypothetical protein